MTYDLIVLGGGAAGYFGALNAKEQAPHLKVAILEAGGSSLTKVKISGGGRCNVTHHCFQPRQLTENYPRGARELLSAFSRFQPQDTIKWFKKRGVELKAEADGRMFPTTNRSETIIQCFEKERIRHGITLELKSRVQHIEWDQDHFQITLKSGKVLQSKFVLMATGSDPKSRDLLTNLGLNLTRCVPSLFTFKIAPFDLKELAGQSVPEAALKLKVNGKTFKRNGPLLVTHWGMSGPAVLKLSAFAAPELFDAGYQGTLTVNWLGHDSYDQALHQLQQLKDSLKQQKVSKTPLSPLSRRLWQYFLNKASIQGEGPWNDVPQKNLRQLAQCLTSASYQVGGKGVFKEEFVTCGGMNRKDIDFRSMESKAQPNLFFAGEVLDIDGITGGFNFQSAWTTSFIASSAIAAKTII